MKKFILCIAIITMCAHLTQAQIYTTKTCEVSFFSEAPMENIEAHNKAAAPILNTSNKELAIRVPITGFVFEKDLMKEHFNENYMESSKYPYGIFKGVINETVDFKKDGTQKVTVTGKLEIHGVSKDRTIDGTLTIKGEEVNLVSNFNVKVADHKIEVPKLVFQNIAETVLVKINATLTPYKK
jgi:hypothetical protein